MKSHDHCLWCGAAMHSAPDDTCQRCGAKHEAEAELIGESWKGSRWIVAPGKAEMRKRALEWSCGARPVAVWSSWDDALRAVWAIFPGKAGFRLVREPENGNPPKLVGVYPTLDDAKAAAAAGGDE